MSDPQPLLKAIKPLETHKADLDSSDTDIEAAARSYSAPKPQAQQTLIFTPIPNGAAPSYRYKSTLKESLTIPDHDNLLMLLVQCCAPCYCCNCCPGWKVREGENLNKETLISRLQSQVLNKLVTHNIESFTVEIYGGPNKVNSKFNDKAALLKFMTEELGYQPAYAEVLHSPSTQNNSPAAFTRN